MDGTERTVIHTLNCSIVDIALDYATQTLYWSTDDFHPQIESSDTDGSNRRVIAANFHNAQSVEFFSGNLYLPSYHSVVSFSVSMPNATQISYHNISNCSYVNYIKVISEARQVPAGTTDCISVSTLV